MKGAMNFESHVILVMSILRLHIDVDQLKNEETP